LTKTDIKVYYIPMNFSAPGAGPNNLSASDALLLEEMQALIAKGDARTNAEEDRLDVVRGLRGLRSMGTFSPEAVAIFSGLIPQLQLAILDELGEAAKHLRAIREIADAPTGGKNEVTVLQNGVQLLLADLMTKLAGMPPDGTRPDTVDSPIATSDADAGHEAGDGI
jgi:hypothetical protein